jgi:hypothetical protein
MQKNERAFVLLGASQTEIWRAGAPMIDGVFACFD